MKSSKITTLAIAIHLAFSFPATANDPFSELDSEIEQMHADDSEEFNQWYVEHLKEFTKWQMENLARWDREKQSSISQWGDAKTPSQDVIVVYDQDKNTRTVVDLVKEEITINYSAPLIKSETSEPASIVNKVIDSNQQLWSELGIESPKQASSNVVKVEPIQVQKKTFENIKQEITSQTERQMSQLDIYAEQNMAIKNSSQKESIIAEQKQVMKVNQQNRLAKAESSINQQQQNHQVKPTLVAEYKVKIPPSALSKRAKTYYPQIQKESTKRNLPPALVLAIMHTESHFNPKARSHIPAYGLMQIVPTSAGHDVNKLYRGHDAPMQPHELYDPDINIETGSEYLNILHRRYLKGISDPDSAAYCVIAAYNTGAGNVARAFGERRVSIAVEKINSMTAEEVYQHLLENLPYQETVNYLNKVSERMKTYQSQINSTI